MVEYKDTLNLPQTDFPMRGNLPEREPKMLTFWHEQDIYEKQRKLFAGKPKYMLHDGPPYANGKIHVGHALNKILKDIIIKSRHQLGYDSPLVPGWDCHGLPIEQKVEQKLGKPGPKVTAAEFRKACREFAASQVELQKEDFIRLGVFAYWDKPYITAAPETEAAIVRGLADIVKNGHIVNGFKPINWCLDCGSSLAEAEVEYQNKTSISIDVRYPVRDLEDLKSRFAYQGDLEAADVVIWTTTPWTLPASVAVTVHADYDYVLVQTSAGVLIVAEELLSGLITHWQLDPHYQVLAKTLGQSLEHLKLAHPFVDERVVPVLNGGHVTLEQGTGCVHTAPAHGVEDYEICKAYGLDLINIVLGNGCYSEDTPYFAGQHVFKANDAVVELLRERGRLLQANKFEHSYPHCWRHKSPTIFRATTQWFISMEKAGLRETALKGLDNVTFTPVWGRPRLTNMIVGRPDWCISRQRYWGVPLCFVVHKESGELHPDVVNIMLKAADAIEKHGIEAWFDLSLQDLIPQQDIPHYDKLDDVLDVWFDSGITHYSVLRQREELSYPADLYLEGSDQHRGWFQSSLLTGSAIDGRPPYRQLLTHGFTVDENGRKMSKSLGNVVDPQSVIKQMGADVLRLWVASADYSAEVNLSNNILKQRADAYRRIRNTCRFLLANLHDFDPIKDMVAKENMLALDRYAVARAKELQDSLIAAYQDFEFHLIYQQLFNFCSVDMGGFYLDVIKDRQYTVNTNNIARRSAQTAIYHILEAMVRWLAPILSFTAEEIWQYMPGEREESVFLTEFYNGLFDLAQDDFDAAFWLLLMQWRERVNNELEKARKEGVIGGSLEADVKITLPEAEYAQLSKLGDELRFALIVSNAVLAVGEPSVAVVKSSAEKCERCWHHVPSVGQNSEHPTLCARCIDNVFGNGEQRQYV